MNTYGRLPVSFVKGSGAYLHDDKGNEYLDALTGIAVCGLGHAHPRVASALSDQGQTLLHTSNLYDIPHQTRLAERLCALSGMDNVFFCNSGAEANEAAIKITRLYAHKNGIEHPIILTANQSFHGRTMATLSATGNEKVQTGFAPLVSEFVHVDFNDIDSIAKHSSNANVVAVMLEPIQGESGVVIPNDDYLNQVQKLCQQNNWLLILDEVQTGIGRTGKMFAHQHNNITPDIMTLAKGLGNGVPIGACLAKGKVAQLFQPGSHGSTFGGNPLVCRVALSVIDVIEKEHVLEHAQKIGNYLLTQFKDSLSDSDKVIDIRGKGMMLAIELNQDCSILLQQALEHNLLINITGQSIRMLPPLIMSQKEADILVAKVTELINAL